MVKYYDVYELIEQAKKAVARRYRHEDKGRSWLKTSLDSYTDSQYRISLLVWEGSPPKGFLVVDWRLNQVHAYDYIGRKLKTFRNKEGFMFDNSYMEHFPEEDTVNKLDKDSDIPSHIRRKKKRESKVTEKESGDIEW